MAARGRAPWLLATGAGLLLACAGARPPVSAPGDACPRRLAALVPATADAWLLVRPRAVFAHPRLGPALGRAFTGAGERALLERALRVGYDLRTVDHALLAWTPQGSLAVGLGSFDATRLADLAWERLLTPRHRATGGRGVVRLEGMLLRRPASLAVAASCGVAAWAEGDPRLVDRVLQPAPPGAAEPGPWLEWHARELPDELRRPAGDALNERMHALALTVQPVAAGLALRLVLEGDPPADGPARLRRALDRLAAGALGAAVGAADWLREDRVQLERRADALELRTEVPWRAVDALAEVLGGQVGRGALP